MDRVLSSVALLFVGGAIVSCSSGSNNGGGSQAAFQLEGISLLNNASWQINREIEFEFSDPVDFASVSSNTINIETATGIPATGTFSFKRIDMDGDGVLDSDDTTTVVFQPNCPIAPDYSDAGFQINQSYRITVIGRSSGTTNTVRSISGRLLSTTQVRNFTTPDSVDPDVLFLDGAFGAPSPVVRSVGTGVTTGVSFIEIAGKTSPAERIFFAFDPTTQTFGIEPGPLAPSELPLNLYSDPSTRSAFFIEFNQPVDPALSNISDSRIRLEYMDSMGTWVRLDTEVTLLANCTEAGATVRLAPIGGLPHSSMFRANVLPGFRDIVGQATTTPMNTFAVLSTQGIDFPSLTFMTNADDGADEFFESFDFDDAEDADAFFDAPQAVWENGTLRAAFDFVGTGGLNGEFDWYVKTGETFVFDTSSTQIPGGPNGVRDSSQTATGGIVDVRDLVIESGGVLRVQGPNPMKVYASGTVRIDGILDLSGFDAPTVSLTNAGDQPTAGGPGAAGGGRGGNGSTRVSNSTMAGGRGSGPFAMPDLGGFGGESGYAPATMGKDSRRPGGGGGGRFALDFEADSTEGLGAIAGLVGHPNSRSAVDDLMPSKGGEPGPPAFADDDDFDDVFGVRPNVTYDGLGVGTVTGFVRGELAKLWAGYGGGAGGDSMPSAQFPTPNWTAASDERGGGGGGGGGGLRICALGPIVFGHDGQLGQILAEGGLGATGENTLALDHVAGTGGSGSGGHVVLESATRVDFTDGDPGWSLSIHPGAEHVSTRGGSQVVGATTDQNGNQIPPDISYGGGGGPGLVQIHVPRLNAPGDDPVATDIVVPDYALATGAGGNLPTDEAAALDAVTKPYARIMFPTISARSKARSQWISIGGSDVNPLAMAPEDLVQFLFEGTDATGLVQASGGTVDELPPILGPEAFPSATALVGADQVTLSISGSSLDPLRLSADPISRDLYLRAPALLQEFTLRVTDTTAPMDTADFDIVSAIYDDPTQTLSITVDGTVQTITSFLAGLATPEYEVIPRFFRIDTNGVDQLPDNATVRITFEGARSDSSGNPIESPLLYPETADIADFNDPLNQGELQFFRFLVEFDLDAAMTGLTTDTETVQVRFLRVPFRY